MAISTLNDADGETLITISDRPEDPVDSACIHKVFDGEMDCCADYITAHTLSADQKKLVQQVVIPCSTSKVRLVVWTNDSVEPDNIFIQVL